MNSKETFLVGTYTRTGPPAPRSEGIHVLDLDPSSGAMTTRLLTGHDRNPSWLLVDAHQGLVWSADELGQAEGGGSVSAFRPCRLHDGQNLDLRRAGTWPLGTDSPCHLGISADRRILAAANYGSGDLSLLGLANDGLPPASGLPGQASGAGSPTGSRTARFGPGSHAHMAWPVVKEDCLEGIFLVPDLGADCLWLVREDADFCKVWTGRPGDGPRHLAGLGRGKFLLLNEFSGDVVLLEAAGGGSGTPVGLREKFRLPLADRPESGSPAGATIKVWRSAGGHPAVSGQARVQDSGGHQGPARDPCRQETGTSQGRVLVLASLRGRYQELVSLVCDTEAGSLELLHRTRVGGRGPRDFAFSKYGSLVLVASQEDHFVESWFLDAVTGRLSPTGHRTTCPSPVCLTALDQASGDAW